MSASVATVEQLSLLLDITERHTQRLTEQGVLTRAAGPDGKAVRGRYDVVKSVRGYVKYLREQARLDDADQSRYAYLRNQKMAAEAEVAALKLKLYKRKLHRAEDVEFVMMTMLTALKSRLLSIPSRTTRLIIGKTNFQEIYGMIYGEIELALRELADYNPNSFTERNDEYLALVNAEPETRDGTGEGTDIENGDAE
jgi:phage terminase Nu1 subunit (DNA packaging protein)